MPEIIPAILEANGQDLKQKLNELPEEIELVHIDVLEEDVWTDTNIPFEAHLMVKEPEKIIARWVDRGSKRVIVHETSPEILKFRAKVEIGLEIEMREFLAEEFKQVPSVDFIHIMSIDEIGEQGHPFDPKVFDRIKEVKAKFPKIPLSVDGGINVTNYLALKESGVDRMIVGSGFKELWKSLTKN